MPCCSSTALLHWPLERRCRAQSCTCFSRDQQHHASSHKWTDCVLESLLAHAVLEDQPVTASPQNYQQNTGLADYICCDRFFRQGEGAMNIVHWTHRRGLGNPYQAMIVGSPKCQMLRQTQDEKYLGLPAGSNASACTIPMPSCTGSDMSACQRDRGTARACKSTAFCICLNGT